MKSSPLAQIPCGVRFSGCIPLSAFSSVGRATDSYSVGPRFESVKAHQTVYRKAHRTWPVGQVVKTEASHAFNIGSNPVRVTTFFKSAGMLVSCYRPKGR